MYVIRNADTGEYVTAPRTLKGVARWLGIGLHVLTARYDLHGYIEVNGYAVAYEGR